MTANDVRNSFLDFFRSKDHEIVPSAPVVPYDDPTLLFTNAGMNQFKNVFLGLETRAYKRAADTQKCIRVSGKHNDLEEVGFDTYHHTFFEMLGNWSFGDYFKKEAIEWAWELLTEVWGIPGDRLYATVFEGDAAENLEPDEESARFWPQVTGISADRVLRFGKKDNFWEMGDVGPCGPCSEIHIDLRSDEERRKVPGHTLVNAGHPEVIELWNLVFIQFNRRNDGSLEPLPARHVDTGMGFERVVAVLQGKKSNYDTDLFQPIIAVISQLSGVDYPGPDGGVAHRVIADHIRALTFAITDGAMPSNEGRGYVLRRLLRRAARFGRKLGMHEPFIYKLVPVVVDVMGDAFPELKEKHQFVALVLQAEEENFNQTLDRGLEIFENIVERLPKEGKKEIPGEDAFRLYDTYGFPLDLTQLIARERGLSVDEEGFQRAMAEQRRKSRAAGKFDYGADLELDKWEALTEGPDSEFLGYTELESESVIRRFHKEDGQLLLTLDRTPFYGEAGGQVGDVGEIVGDGFRLRVLNTIRVGNSIVHVGDLEGEISDPKVVARVDAQKRRATQRNHTSTHLLHKALRETLGTHVVQAGSLVAPDRLRFDVTHFQKITPEELDAIEARVNEKIRADLPVEWFYTTFVKARELGAMAIFEEKYGETVRVVKVGDYSLELCGGTHVNHTGEIGYFRIVSESSAAAGIRRLEAVTGDVSDRLLRQEHHLLLELQQLLNCSEQEVTERVEHLLLDHKRLQKELREARLKVAQGQIARLVEQAEQLNSFRIVSSKVEISDIEELKAVSDTLRSKLGSGVGVLGAILNGKVSFVCVVTDDLIQRYNLKAGEIVRRVAEVTGGSGGGRPHMALAGGKETNKLDEALSKVSDIVKKIKEGGS
jgi:alanyl-tRNA synthetase